ncbi:ABC transporter substrate-binding protein [Sulfurifustis variabilis]|uniref:ABC transporter substrate-binding protein n=1 Tax=Sulfurifustis variabilis TaxID=1675686 RepID=A0A1B4V7T8_9GAMM|nr:ABC transporter substrate binding protein [Sulfurifustis variabilis]BAU48702.1 ABC transporter substrate-binding protein [Sulfurifustis variabilis]
MAEASCRTGARARPPLLPLWLLLAVLAGCAQFGTRPDRMDGEPAPPGRVAILVSDALPAYEGVAEILVQRLYPTPVVYRLGGSAFDPRQMVDALEVERGVPIVAIGPEALHAATLISARPVVFCQVYNYDGTDAGLARRGVKAMPPAAKQLQAWKLLDPRLRRVALLTGPGLKELADEARAAAKRAQLELEHVEVRSDKELLYAVKRLDRGIQGVWLAPDRQVLSAEVLREALSHSVRQGMSVLAFSPQLLPYGALLSVESEYGDVAEQVIAQINGLGGKKRDDVLALTRARVEINPLVARHLGLTVPRPLQGGAYVF